MFFHLELNDTSIGLLLVGALFLTGIINLYRIFGHFGHLPILAGLSLLGLSGLALYSSISINGSEKLIELDEDIKFHEEGRDMIEKRLRAVSGFFGRFASSE